MRTLAIGDIHGCYPALETLLEAAAITPNDFLIFLGDYIDRGPDSKAVVSHLIQRLEAGRAIALRGNHEVMILDARQDSLQSGLWQSCGGDETLHSYGAGYRDDWPGFVPEDHWKFFEETRPWFETETHIYVHATVSPDLAMRDQPDDLLYWEHIDAGVYHKSGKIVVCGHSAQLTGLPLCGKHSICIDTGACYGQWLTCLDVDAGKFWQTNDDRIVRAGELPSLH